MLDENSFDEIIRDKLAQQTFKPGAASWKKAQQLIRSEKIRKRNRFYFSAFVFFIGAAGVLLGFYLSANSEKAKNNLASSAKNQSGIDTTSANHTITAGNSGKELTNESADNPNASSPENTNGDSAASKTAAVNKSNKQNKIDTEQENKSTISNSGIKKTKLASNSSAAETENRVDHFLSKNRSVNRTNLQTEIPFTNKIIDYHPHAADTTMRHAETTKYDSDTAMQRIATVHQDSTGWKTAKPAEPNTDTTQNEITTVNAWHNSGKANFWFAEAGISWLPGIGNMPVSVNPLLGGGYSVRLGMRTGLNAGLNYTYIGNPSDSNSVYTSTVYGFGQEIQHTEIELKRLHYVVMPVNIQWHFSGRHSLSGGINTCYLFLTESKEHSYTETNSIISNEKSSPVFGYRLGISRFDFQINAGYAFQLNPYWSIRTSAYCGLVDLKNNSWYGVNKFERNCGIRFGLQYDF